MWPFRVCTMHPTIIIGTVRSFRTWLWDRYHVPQNVLLVFSERELKFMFAICRRPSVCRLSSVVCLSVVCRLSVVCNVGAPYSGD